jgi:hypothetical protein
VEGVAERAVPATVLCSGMKYGTPGARRLMSRVDGMMWEVRMNG